MVTFFIEEVYFLKTKVKKINNPDLFIINLVNLTGCSLVIYSLIQFIVYGIPRFVFPLTLEGADPHLYGFSLMSLFIISFTLLINVISKVNFAYLFFLCIQSGLILFGALLTGSRGVFLYGFIAFLPHIIKLIIGLFNKIKINKKVFFNFIFILFLILISVLLFDSIRKEIYFMTVRVFTITSILSGQDASRSRLIQDILDILQNSSSYTLFGKDFRTSLADSGVVFYLLNFGVLGSIIFNGALLSLAFPKSFFLKNYYVPSIYTKFHILGIFFYNLISSESIVIPRCTLIIALSTACFLIMDEFNLFKKKLI